VRVRVCVADMRAAKVVRQTLLCVGRVRGAAPHLDAERVRVRMEVGHERLGRKRAGVFGGRRGRGRQGVRGVGSRSRTLCG
jgi:hypothetical protein